MQPNPNCLLVTLLFAIALVLSSAALTAQTGNPAIDGYWEPGFNHAGAQTQSPPMTDPVTGGTVIRNWPVRCQAPLAPDFHAIHMSLIPTGPHKGKVLVWDADGWYCGDTPSPIYVRWSVIDPELDQLNPNKFANYWLRIDGGKGDLFCAGHVWDRDGRLFVAGGTLRHKDLPGVGQTCSMMPTHYIGSVLALRYDPQDLTQTPHGRWTLLPDMAVRPWYPSATILGNGMISVDGGVDDTNFGGVRQELNDFEIWDPTANGGAGGWKAKSGPQNTNNCGLNDLRRWCGPATAGVKLADYPREHVLQSGDTFFGVAASGVEWSHHRSFPSDQHPRHHVRAGGSLDRDGQPGPTRLRHRGLGAQGQPHGSPGPDHALRRHGRRCIGTRHEVVHRQRDIRSRLELELGPSPEHGTRVPQ